MKNFTLLFLLISLSFLFNETYAQDLSLTKQSKAAFTITIETVVGGTATVSTTPDATCEEAGNVTVTISNIEVGKQFSAIDIIADDLSVINTSEVTAGVEYTFVMPAQNVTITVTLEDIPAVTYTITTHLLGGTATVTTLPATEAEEAELVTVTIADIEVGKQFSLIDVIGDDLSIISTTLISEGIEYSFIMPNQDVDITVILEDIPAPVYDIVVNITGGTADVVTNPVDEAEEAELVTVTISNLEVGKQFLSIDVIAEDLSAIATTEVTAGEEYTFVMPAQNVNITVTLEDIPVPVYDIVVNVIGGTADVVTNPVDEAEEAELVTVTISNIEVGKLFSAIDVIAEDLSVITTSVVTAGEEYTFVMPDQNVTVTVTVEDIPVTYQIITTVMEGTATVTTAPASIAEENDNVIVSISDIESGKIFGMIEVWADAVEISTVEVLPGIEYTFTMPAHDVAIYVHLQDEIIDPIIINEQPESQIICEYNFATLTVDAQATMAETLEYQWYYNETILEDSINNTIIVNTAGEYYCLLTAGLDELETETAVITVAIVNPELLSTISACSGSTIELNPGVFTEYEWQDESAEQILEVTEGGTYSVTVTDVNGCTESAETVVSFDDEISFDLGVTIHLCQGSDAVITGPAFAETYEWGEGEDTQEITVTEAGWYYLTITQATCTANDSVLVEIVDLPEVFDLGEDIFACDGTTVTIEGPEIDDIDYLWNTEETTQEIEVTESSTYSLTITNEYGCDRSNDIYVEFNDFIVPNLHTSDSIYSCVGETITLDPQEGIAWLWSDESTESSLDVETTGWYFVTVTVTGGCQGADSVYVLFHTLPLIDLGANQAVCDGLSSILTAPEYEIYLWNTGDSLQSITVDTAGVYSCTITDINGCSNSDQMTFSIFNLPGVDLGADIIVDESQIIILGVETGHTEYLWSTEATTDYIVIDASTLGLGTHTYSVTVTSANDCTAEDEIVITVIPGAGVLENNLKSVSIYPNPSNGIINISGDDIISIDIYDNAGKHVLTTTERQIDLSYLAKGIYTIQIKTNKISLNSKLILD